MTHTPGDPLVAALIEQLRAMRDAERDVFGSIQPDVRDRPMRPNDWSPKDHQAHLTAWKARQSERIEAAVRGEAPRSDDRETDEENAELQATRADWPWEAIDREADTVGEQLEAAIRSAGAILTESAQLVGQIYGNGAAHALTHFAWLVDARIGVDEDRVAAFFEEHERHLSRAGIPDGERGVGLYNLACAHAVGGRLDRARPLLRIAFRLRPDLGEYAREDPELIELRDELSFLVG
ncbi:MAG: ClbS/DfsB family four-helix bundle protein [Chloroflexota bacterium]|nr:ClbS/DfsB family four-helix bundle protein [Chloroflexota bacterium]